VESTNTQGNSRGCRPIYWPPEGVGFNRASSGAALGMRPDALAPADALALAAKPSQTMGTRACDGMQCAVTYTAQKRCRRNLWDAPDRSRLTGGSCLVDRDAAGLITFHAFHWKLVSAVPCLLAVLPVAVVNHWPERLTERVDLRLVPCDPVSHERGRSDRPKCVEWAPEKCARA
jgi:hypothetical protein